MPSIHCRPSASKQVALHHKFSTSCFRALASHINHIPGKTKWKGPGNYYNPNQSQDGENQIPKWNKEEIRLGRKEIIPGKVTHGPSLLPVQASHHLPTRCRPSQIPFGSWQRPLIPPPHLHPVPAHLMIKRASWYYNWYFHFWSYILLLQDEVVVLLYSKWCVSRFWSMYFWGIEPEINAFSYCEGTGPDTYRNGVTECGGKYTIVVPGGLTTSPLGPTSASPSVSTSPSCSTIPVISSIFSNMHAHSTSWKKAINGVCYNDNVFPLHEREPLFHNL